MENYQFLFPKTMGDDFIYYYSNLIDQTNKKEFKFQNDAFFIFTNILNRIYFILDIFNRIFYGKSVFFTQLKYRIYQYQNVWFFWLNIPSLNCYSFCNIICSILFDQLLGIGFALFIHQYTTQFYLMNYIDKSITLLVQHIYDLLVQFESMPAGLKLNQPFNEAISQLMFYHIYLWKNYIIILNNTIFPISILLFSYFCIFGLSFSLRFG